MKNKQGKKSGSKDKAKAIKVSYYSRPEGMSLEEWQIALRKQAAEKESFNICPISESLYPGDYCVKNPITRNEYKVVFRGIDSPWNYCSCMDFKTSRLGTCKHIEAVHLWTETNHKRVYRGNPPYTSVYLSYRGEREIRLRIGSDHEMEFRQLAKPYFTPDGRMRPEALPVITDFYRDALQIDNTFRWYSDALTFVLEQRDKIKRERIITDRYPDTELNQLLTVPLYPYQREGIRFAFRAGKSIIADEMGLGKTIQAIGTAELLKKEGLISSVLVLCPTSLKYQWKREIERFTHSSVVVVEGNPLQRKQLYQASEFYKIVSYNSVSNDIRLTGSLHTDLVIMDEVQRLKNWKTQISRSVRHIEADYAIVLSGTPLENKLEELYSIMQFVDQYCLGPYYQFMEHTVVTSETGKVIGYKNLNEVGERMKHVLLRRRKRDVALQLPERMDKILFVSMTEQQKAMHDEFKSSVARLIYKWTRTRFLSEKDRKRLLLLLSQMRMVCDSTYILDQKSRYDTKIAEVMSILQNVFENGDEKVVIFSQWERMTRLVAQELDKLDIRYEYLHGGIPSAKRKDLMQNFTDLPESRVFLSTDAGSTGLNLQVASILINLDLPWNPAVLEQRIARIYRIGQQRNIQVINMVASNTIEEQMLSTLNFKSSLFEGILDNGADSIFLEDSKFDKMVDSIREVMEKTDASAAANKESAVKPEECEDNADKASTPSAAEPTLFDNLSFDSEVQVESPEDDEITSDNLSAEETKQRGQEVHPQELLQQGFSFLSGLARTLSSPEATKKLVDALVTEDKETGETTLRIPVPDKESVSQVLNLLGKLLGKSPQ